MQPKIIIKVFNLWLTHKCIWSKMRCWPVIYPKDLGLCYFGAAQLCTIHMYCSIIRLWGILRTFLFLIQFCKAVTLQCSDFLGLAMAPKGKMFFPLQGCLTGCCHLEAAFLIYVALSQAQAVSCWLPGFAFLFPEITFGLSI